MGTNWPVIWVKSRRGRARPITLTIGCYQPRSLFVESIVDTLRHVVPFHTALILLLEQHAANVNVVAGVTRKDMCIQMSNEDIISVNPRRFTITSLVLEATTAYYYVMPSDDNGSEESSAVLGEDRPLNALGRRGHLTALFDTRSDTSVLERIAHFDGMLIHLLKMLIVHVRAIDVTNVKYATIEDQTKHNRVLSNGKVTLQE